jgi:hypothetical protein
VAAQIHDRVALGAVEVGIGGGDGGGVTMGHRHHVGQ